MNPAFDRFRFMVGAARRKITENPFPFPNWLEQQGLPKRCMSVPDSFPVLPGFRLGPFSGWIEFPSPTLGLQNPVHPPFTVRRSEQKIRRLTKFFLEISCKGRLTLQVLNWEQSPFPEIPFFVMSEFQLQFLTRGS